MSARRKVAAPVSLGTFDESEARAIAHLLATTERITATVARLHVGEHDDQPTEWWHVYVPGKQEIVASTWLRGYRSGRVVHRIGVYATDHGGTFNEAATRLGYPELVVPL